MAWGQPGLGLSGHLFSQHLHQARFADAGFAAEQHHLPKAVLDLFPELPQQPHLLVAPGGTPGSVVDDALAALGRSRRVAVAVPHFLVVPHVLAATDLIATLPSRVVDALAEPRDLVRLPPPLALPGFGVEMIWHERSHHDPAQRWLRDQVLAVAAALA